MRKIALAITAFVISTALFAQSDVIENHPKRWSYSPDLKEAELFNGDRLAHMLREDWVAFRQDPRFDQDRAYALINQYKDEVRAQQGGVKSMTACAETSCGWIEPDASYIHADIGTWSTPAGSGWTPFDEGYKVINLGFDFCFFGQTYTQVCITSNGTLMMGGGGIPNGYWVPYEFPTPTAGTPTQFDHICPFWADSDLGPSGDIYYLLTSDALYVNWIDIARFGGNAQLTNSFQVIITATGSPVLGGTANMQFAYQDMQWTAPGGSGFQGASPANVGADRIASAGNAHVQLGRFNLNNTNYNGAYGQAAAQQDGVSWLDDKVFTHNLCAVPTANLAPLPVGDFPCAPISLCLNETHFMDITFLSPEANQSTTITYTQSGTGFTATTTNGNVAHIVGTFTGDASNLGVNTVTVTATDNANPALSTSLTFTFDVQNLETPVVSIDGVTAICAGGETTLTATEGFSNYCWSNGDSGQSVVVETGGTYTVIATNGACNASASVAVTVSPYQIPDLLVNGVLTDNNPVQVCPGEVVEICIEGTFASYSWTIADNSENGAFEPNSATNQSCAFVTANESGTYTVIAEDLAGCQFQNSQIISSSGDNSYIDVANDANAGPHCDGLLPVEFAGSFSSPQSSSMLLYLFSNYPSGGWQGSYLNVSVFDSQGTLLYEQFALTTALSFQILGNPQPAMQINYGDSISVSFVSVTGAADPGLYFTLVQCGSSTTIGQTGGLAPGVVYTGVASCTASPLVGQWTVTGPSGSTFSDPSQYNTTWTPTQYGQYEVCFTETQSACLTEKCYEMDFTLDPQVIITPGVNISLCDNETASVTIAVTDPGGNGSIAWSGFGVTPSADGLSAVAGPYSIYVDGPVTATVTNACGTNGDAFNLTYNPNINPISLTDQLICGNVGYTIDPVPASQENPGLHYSWTPGGSTGSTLFVNQSGTYTVVVSNDCDTAAPASATMTVVSPAVLTTVPPTTITDCGNNGGIPLTVNVPQGYHITWSTQATTSTINVTTSGIYSYVVTDDLGCNTTTTGSSNVSVIPAANLTTVPAPQVINCASDSVTLTIGVPNGYSGTWNTGATTNSITVGESGTYAYDVTDTQGCDTHTTGTTNVVITRTPQIYQPAATSLTVCPENCVDLSCASAQSATYTWATSCGDLELTPNGSNLQVCSDNVPVSCQIAPFSVTGTATNVCGTASIIYTLVTDICFLEFHDVITPNGDGKNEKFVIEGIEQYTNAKLKVFDRWGKEVYANEHYSNGWSPTDLSSGTYYYIVTLPYGTVKEKAGYFTILTTE